MTHIHWRNSPAKFHPDRIWNDGALAFCKKLPQQEEQEKEAKAQEQDEYWEQYGNSLWSKNRANARIWAGM